MYAKIDAGVVTQYPYKLRDLQRDYPRVSFEVPLTALTLAAFNIVNVEEVTRPESDVATVAEGTPVFTGGRWVQNWVLTALPPAEIAARQAEAAKRNEVEQAKTDARADTFVQQFVEMTPAQVIAYVNANVGSLAEAKQLLTKLALMMLAIAKEQYK